MSQCGEGCGHCRPVRFFQICHPVQGELCAAQHEAATLCAGLGPAGQAPSQAGEEVVPGAPPTCPTACPVTLLCVPNQAWKQKWQKKGECFGGGQPRAPAQDSCFQRGQLSQWASRCPQPGEASDLDASLLSGRGGQSLAAWVSRPALSDPRFTPQCDGGHPKAWGVGHHCEQHFPKAGSLANPSCLVSVTV